MEADQTTLYLQRFHAGDREALNALLSRHLPWIRARVHKRLGPRLRRKDETEDVVQDAMVRFLQDGPRFLVADGDHFRALIARIVENVLRDRNDWFTARRRQIGREQALPEDSVLDLSVSGSSRPSVVAQKREWEAWIRLGLELLDPEDRNVIVLRQWDDLSFAEIGEKLGLSEDAARMRFNRALPRLTEKMESLRAGRTADLLEEEPEPPAGG